MKIPTTFRIDGSQSPATVTAVTLFFGKSRRNMRRKKNGGFFFSSNVLWATHDDCLVTLTWVSLGVFNFGSIKGHELKSE